MHYHANEKQLLTTDQLIPSLSPSSSHYLLANSPSSYAEHDVIWYWISLWPVWVSYPSCVPSYLLVYLQPFRWQGM